MTNKAITYLAIRGFLIWLTLSIIGFLWGDKIISPLLPFYESIFEFASSNLSAQTELISIKKEAHIALTATVTQTLQLTAEAAFRTGDTFKASVTTLHALVPLVISLTILFTWPMRSVKQLGLHCVAAVPTVFIVSGLTVPFQLLGWINITFQNILSNAGLYREEPLALKWMLLTEGGGRWFIAAIVGLGFAVLASHISKKLASQTA